MAPTALLLVVLAVAALHAPAANAALSPGATSDPVRGGHRVLLAVPGARRGGGAARPALARAHQRLLRGVPARRFRRGRRRRRRGGMPLPPAPRPAPPRLPRRRRAPRRSPPHLRLRENLRRHGRRGRGPLRRQVPRAQVTA
uniref:Lipid transfer protein Ms5-D n=1 Tax=Triticum aestivum TaxID=4565 RepID=A0A4D6Q420_WHEAT|nr:lipid transfer protein Ms5-D [Triticum aestivum]